MKFKVEKRIFNNIEDAKKYAQKIYDRTGHIVAITEKQCKRIKYCATVETLPSGAIGVFSDTAFYFHSFETEREKLTDYILSEFAKRPDTEIRFIKQISKV